MSKNAPIGDRLLRAAGRIVALCIYRVHAHGVENLPEGGFLLAPNHMTWIDAVVLQLACPRPIRFIVDEGIYNLRFLNPIFRIVNALPISPAHARESMRAAAKSIEEGEVVCIFPEGELTRSGLMSRIHRGYEVIARQAKAPVVPVWMDQLWGSIFSFKGGKYFLKVPKRVPFTVTVAFGAPIPAMEANVAVLLERYLSLSEFCYQRREMLKGHIGAACVQGLMRRKRATATIDGTDHRTMSRGTVLAAAIALSRRLMVTCPEKRVAIVLPPGKGALIANLAVALACKTPVNLNFTAGKSANEAAIRIAGVRHCITAKAVEKRLNDFPWPEGRIHLEEVLPALKKRIAYWRGIVAFMPHWAVTRMLGIPRIGDRDEAIILFTSGSAGEPKGVVLSHRNILGNVSQFSLMLNLSDRDAVLANLPFFHSFGCTVTLWFPLMEGIRSVTYPNPLEVAKSADLIERYGITLFCTTPTFLRGYLRKIEREKLATVDLLVTGAEKLPVELSEAFQERFGIEVLQGYGLTETSPVVSVNLPDPKPYSATDRPQPTCRRGSVGKLAPGMAAQIRDPDSGAPLTLHETGMLWLRGPNIFEGYLDDPKRTSEVLQDGWFKTGDLARFDEDGFLFIEGRLSRFSKIAGEMVPHETIESKIYEALGLSNNERVIAVTSIPDEAKGEALVLLSSRDMDQADLRSKLIGAGLPNLWIPKRIHRIDAIPVLASGKLDLRRCKEAALESAAEKPSEPVPASP